MKKSLLLALALAVIPVGVDAQVPDLEMMRGLAAQGIPSAQALLGFMYDNGQGVPEDDTEPVRWYRLAAEQGYAATPTRSPAFGSTRARGSRSSCVMGKRSDAAAPVARMWVCIA